MGLTEPNGGAVGARRRGPDGGGRTEGPARRGGQGRFWDLTGGGGLDAEMGG
jgi:hypothetical protein